MSIRMSRGGCYGVDYTYTEINIYININTYTDTYTDTDIDTDTNTVEREIRFRSCRTAQWCQKDPR